MGRPHSQLARDQDLKKGPVGGHNAKSAHARLSTVEQIGATTAASAGAPVDFALDGAVNPVRRTP